MGSGRLPTCATVGHVWTTSPRAAQGTPAWSAAETVRGYAANRVHRGSTPLAVARRLASGLARTAQAATCQQQARRAARPAIGVVNMQSQARPRARNVPLERMRCLGLPGRRARRVHSRVARGYTLRAGGRVRARVSPVRVSRALLDRCAVDVVVRVRVHVSLVRPTPG